MRHLVFDVLVVGGGLAALRAAYEAAGNGASVGLAVKGKAGRSGSSAMTSAGYSVARRDPDSPEIHYEDTVRGGRGLGVPELIRIMVDEAPDRLSELIALGAPLAQDDAGRDQINQSGDHTVARTYVAANHSGLDFTEPLTRAVMDRGVDILEMTAILDIIVRGREVVGAVGVNYRSEEALVISAPSVILGTGGAGRLFAVTSNPSDATGDGYALALRAGAQLRDMEFIQFYPWRCVVPFDRSRMPIQPATFVLGGKLYNAQGERFMLSVDPERHEATTRDLAARGIYDEIHQGRGIKGGVRLDVSALSFADWESSNPRPARHFLDRGLDFHEEEMILAPEAHFFMGGVVVDSNAQSRVPGLYAVGEVAGGVHGANRLDSNAIPETQVFGARAGRVAADRAKLQLAGPNLDHERAEEQVLAGELHQITSGLDYAKVRRELQDVMWEYLGISRDGAEMQLGLSRVVALTEQVRADRPMGLGALVRRRSLENSLLVSRCCFMAALDRKESRGAHYRRDYPQQDDARWRRALILELSVRGEPVVASDAQVSTAAVL